MCAASWLIFFCVQNQNATVVKPNDVLWFTMKTNKSVFVMEERKITTDICIMFLLSSGSGMLSNFLIIIHSLEIAQSPASGSIKLGFGYAV